ncbi:MAG: DUF1573 domain-containing protein [Bacteroidota bacterium]|nr:DUF1573 domain-containing protein [Bacteroidota bacterium]
MKYITILAAFIFLGFNSNAQSWNSGNSSITTSSDTGVQWDKTNADLGELLIGSETNVRFQMTNVSGRAIIITNAQGSCGCTQIVYPKYPIKSGETIDITVIYEADDIGTFNKTAMLTMNIEQSRQVLHIKGSVKNR